MSSSDKGTSPRHAEAADTKDRVEQKRPRVPFDTKAYWRAEEKLSRDDRRDRFPGVQIVGSEDMITWADYSALIEPSDTKTIVTELKTKFEKFDSATAKMVAKLADMKDGSNAKRALLSFDWDEDDLACSFSTEAFDYTVDEELNRKVSLYLGDITSLEVDAIVNAANEAMRGGGGIDGRIHSVAGPSLLKECIELNGCPTGRTKATRGHQLPCKFILHTVGPKCQSDDHPLPQAKLIGCYSTILDWVAALNIRTVAIPCISTGIFNYPLYAATHTALKITRKWLETGDNRNKVDRIIFCVYGVPEWDMYEKLLQVYFPFIESYPKLSQPSSKKYSNIAKAFVDPAPTSAAEFIAAIRRARTRQGATEDAQLDLSTLQELIEGLGKAEKKQFFKTTLPYIADLHARRKEILANFEPALLVQYGSESLEFTREQIACFLASSFLTCVAQQGFHYQQFASSSFEPLWKSVDAATSPSDAVAAHHHALQTSTVDLISINHASENTRKVPTRPAHSESEGSEEHSDADGGAGAAVGDEKKAASPSPAPAVEVTQDEEAAGTSAVLIAKTSRKSKKTNDTADSPSSSASSTANNTPNATTPSTPSTPAASVAPSPAALKKNAHAKFLSILTYFSSVQGDSTGTVKISRITPPAPKVKLKLEEIHQAFPVLHSGQTSIFHAIPDTQTFMVPCNPLIAQNALSHVEMLSMTDYLIWTCPELVALSIFVSKLLPGEVVRVEGARSVNSLKYQGGTLEWIGVSPNQKPFSISKILFVPQQDMDIPRHIRTRWFIESEIQKLMAAMRTFDPRPLKVATLNWACDAVYRSDPGIRDFLLLFALMSFETLAFGEKFKDKKNLAYRETSKPELFLHDSYNDINDINQLVQIINEQEVDYPIVLETIRGIPPIGVKLSGQGNLLNQMVQRFADWHKEYRHYLKIKQKEEEARQKQLQKERDARQVAMMKAMKEQEKAAKLAKKVAEEADKAELAAAKKADAEHHKKDTDKDHKSDKKEPGKDKAAPKKDDKKDDKKEDKADKKSTGGSHSARKNFVSVSSADDDEMAEEE